MNQLSKALLICVAAALFTSLAIAASTQNETKPVMEQKHKATEYKAKEPSKMHMNQKEPTMMKNEPAMMKNTPPK